MCIPIIASWSKSSKASFPTNAIYVLKFMSNVLPPFFLFRFRFICILAHTEACLLQTSKLEQARVVGKEVRLSLVEDTNGALQKLAAAGL